jgi:hypothetical protein
VHLGRAHDHLIFLILLRAEQPAAGLGRLRTLRERDDAAALGKRRRSGGNAQQGDAGERQRANGSHPRGRTPPAQPRAQPADMDERWSQPSPILLMQQHH